MKTVFLFVENVKRAILGGTSEKLGAYTACKKDVLSILRNEPLLFVQGPPVYTKVVIRDEESTSVYTFMNDGVVETENMEETVQEVVAPVKMADPSLVKKVLYLGSPFQRQVYQPLQFVLADETLTGAIEKIEGETIVVELNEGTKEFVAIDISHIEEILWRGSPFDGQ